MRRAFLMLFPGLAWGQSTATLGVHQPPKRRPLNGECPVCGTVAPKFEPKLSDYYADNACLSQRVPVGTKIGEIVSVIASCRHPDVSDLPKRQEVDCAHCRNAFYQDAEVSK